MWPNRQNSNQNSKLHLSSRQSRRIELQLRSFRIQRRQISKRSAAIDCRDGHLRAFTFFIERRRPAAAVYIMAYVSLYSPDEHCQEAKPRLWGVGPRVEMILCDLEQQRTEDAPMVLTATLFLQCLMSFAIFAPLVMAPVVLDTLAIPANWVGLYAPFAFGCAIIGSIFSGALLRYLGPWRLSLVCLAFTAVGIFVFGLATPVAVATGAMILGLSYGPITAAGASLLVQTTSNNLALRLSIRQSGVPLGSSLAGFVLPPLSKAFGWSGTCNLVSVAAIATAILLMIGSPVLAPKHVRDPARTPSGRFRPMRLVLSNSRLRRLAFVLVFFASLQNCFASFLSVYLVRDLGTNLVFAGSLLGLSYGVGIFTRILWGALADRLGAHRVIGLLGITMAIAAALTGMLEAGAPLLILVAIVVVFGAAVTGWNGVAIAQATQSVPASLAGAAAGEITVFVYGGFIAGPLLFTLVAGAIGIQHAFIVAGIICAAATAVFLMSERKCAP